MYKGDGFSAKSLGESLSHCQDVQSSHGPTGQFWLLESVIRGLELKSLKFKDVIPGFFFNCPDLLKIEPNTPATEPVKYDKKDGQWYTHNGVDVQDTQQRKGTSKSVVTPAVTS